MSKVKAIFINGQGRMRLGWLLALSVVLYGLATAGVYYGYWHLYRNMMDIWGVTSKNVHCAPEAVRFLYSWSGVVEQILEGVAVFAAAWAIRKLDGLRMNRGTPGAAGIGAGIGAAAIGLIWLVLLASGCVRLGWRLTEPEISVNTFALLVTTLIAASAEAVFLCGTLYEGIKKRLPEWAALAAAVVFYGLIALADGVTEPVAMVNAALTALAACMIAQHRGVSAAIGFRFAWEYLSQAVFGLAGETAALYETYPVNWYWLNGGNAGIMNGVMTAAVLCGLIVLLVRKERSKSPS